MVSECKIVSAVDFQRQSEELGSNIKVISTDPSIDDGDSFFIPQPDGSSRVLDRGDPRIQAVIARVQSDCTNKLGKRNRKEALRQDIERAFGVKLKPHKMFRCPCEGQHQQGQHQQGPAATLRRSRYYSFPAQI